MLAMLPKGDVFQIRCSNLVRRHMSRFGSTGILLIRIQHLLLTQRPIHTYLKEPKNRIRKEYGSFEIYGMV